jgi:protein gp37
MAENSAIEWTTHTFNPWIGCQKVGPGCDHCYAEAMDHRFGGERWGPHAARTRTSAANWRLPLKWNKAAAGAAERPRVFCASMADVFDNHASILPEWRDDLWALIEATPNLDWMLLTKRPGNIASMLPVPFDFERLYPNVWLGCTVVNQAEADRDVKKLLAVDAAVRFLSMEPLLGPVDLTRWFYGFDKACDQCPKDEYCECGWQMRRDLPDNIAPGSIDLVIVGGESGPGARPMHPDWARSLRDQCNAAGVAFHFKQWGEWAPVKKLLPSQPGDLTYWPDGSFGAGGANEKGGCGRTMRRIGKRVTGRLLDGRTWDEMPGVRDGKA